MYLCIRSTVQASKSKHHARIRQNKKRRTASKPNNSPALPNNNVNSTVNRSSTRTHPPTTTAPGKRALRGHPTLTGNGGEKHLPGNRLFHRVVERPPGEEVDVQPAASFRRHSHVHLPGQNILHRRLPRQYLSALGVIAGGYRNVVGLGGGVARGGRQAAEKREGGDRIG